MNGPATCAYCGELADSVDHVPPRSARSRLRASGYKGMFFEVDACRECNSALTDLSLFTLSKRRARIASYLRRKYRKYLRAPDWTEAQRESLGDQGLLRSGVDSGLRLRDVARRRLAFALSRHSGPGRVNPRRATSIEVPSKCWRKLPHKSAKLLGNAGRARVDQARRPIEPRRWIKCALEGCDVIFAPAHEWQRFHTEECQRAFRARYGHKHRISSVSVLKGGVVSVVIRVPADRAASLKVGQTVEVYPDAETAGRTLELVESE